ncbi:hypothetical protein AAHA92_12708 [Salvia divinorum]|uniref:EGF-like domain-containing protein n=1 Tax=Salvia divinorum TaxID=28513 RepID=A0ABD1HL48_SALDI
MRLALHSSAAPPSCIMALGFKNFILTCSCSLKSWDGEKCTFVLLCRRRHSPPSSSSTPSDLSRFFVNVNCEHYCVGGGRSLSRLGLGCACSLGKEICSDLGDINRKGRFSGQMPMFDTHVLISRWPVKMLLARWPEHLFMFTPAFISEFPFNNGSLVNPVPANNLVNIHSIFWTHVFCVCYQTHP